MGFEGDAGAAHFDGQVLQGAPFGRGQDERLLAHHQRDGEPGPGLADGQGGYSADRQ